ncbi:MAG: NAD(P)(+) transhydrogenase (Re/Si-specific) subunit beta [Chitinophagales bacterium]
MGLNILTICYLLASVSFILGLKMLSDPATAKRGNRIAALGMCLAIFATIALYRDENDRHLHNLGWIFAGLVVGTVIGAFAAKKVKMTAMPEMVSIFNGMGGACAALISISEIHHLNAQTGKGAYEISSSFGITVILGLIIGSVSFAGSVIAWGKLNGKIKDYSFKGQHVANLALLFIVFLLAIFFVKGNEAQWSTLSLIIFVLALVYGIMFVLPIGGADMPVVISLLNSFTGVAAACGGFLYDNKAMLTGGILVGAAGTLLTILMCKAMNRSLKNVLIGSFGSSHAASAQHVDGQDQGTIKEIPVSEAAILMTYANKVMIVPGYGLAVAQAQHACHELEKLLTVKGVDVKYAIHPVAGRMPGHMNVLLAEADVSYDKLLEMDQANEEFKTTDIALVLGANDVVNPAAKTDPSSPIYGMPILEVELAKTVIVNKRSMKPGYAGIENQLFFKPKTSMLFGDAKDVLQHLTMIIKNL